MLHLFIGTGQQGFAAGLGVMKDLAQIAGFVGAALFFGYRFFSGYLFPNIGISVECERQRSCDGITDHLAANVTVTKGEQRTVRFTRAVVRLYELPDGPRVEKELYVIYREEGEKAGQHSRPERLNLAPGDQTELAGFFEKLDAQKVYRVEVIVLADRLSLKVMLNPVHWKSGKRHRTCQWRAARICLPVFGKS